MKYIVKAKGKARFSYRVDADCAFDACEKVAVSLNEGTASDYYAIKADPKL